MTTEPRVEPEDEMELDEDEDEDEELLVVNRRPDGGIEFFVQPDALEAGPWGIVLADAATMIAWSLAKSSGDTSNRRQAEMLVQVKRVLLAELANPSSDLEVWTERFSKED